jgi:ATP-dependent protease ClpP protease subunit
MSGKQAKDYGLIDEVIERTVVAKAKAKTDGG